MTLTENECIKIQYKNTLIQYNIKLRFVLRRAMNELIPLIESGMDWKSYEQHFSFWNRLPKEAFIKFAAKKLDGKLASEPSEISFRVDRAWDNHLYLIGNIHRGSETDHVQGEAVWLPKSKSFRGHLLVNPPSAEELQLEEIEELRKSEWHLKKWQPNGKPKHTHDHCGVCWQSIYETDNETEGFGYTNRYDWVCQKCYVEHLR